MKNLYYDIMRKKFQFEEQHDSYDERNFVLCRSCFWCASILNTRYRYLNSCPSCMNPELESMPISLDDIYTFDHDPRQGVSLGFWNNK